MLTVNKDLASLADGLKTDFDIDNVDKADMILSLLATETN